MSAITVLGVPAEVFRHGTGYGMFSFSYFLFIPVVAHCLIPVFYDMRITSVYEVSVAGSCVVCCLDRCWEFVSFQTLVHFQKFY